MLDIDVNRQGYREACASLRNDHSDKLGPIRIVRNNSPGESISRVFAAFGVGFFCPELYFSRFPHDLPMGEMFRGKLEHTNAYLNRLAVGANPCALDEAIKKIDNLLQFIDTSQRRSAGDAAVERELLLDQAPETANDYWLAVNHLFPSSRLHYWILLGNAFFRLLADTTHWMWSDNPAAIADLANAARAVKTPDLSQVTNIPSSIEIAGIAGSLLSPAAFISTIERFTVLQDEKQPLRLFETDPDSGDEVMRDVTIIKCFQAVLGHEAMPDHSFIKYEDSGEADSPDLVVARIHRILGHLESEIVTCYVDSIAGLDEDISGRTFELPRQFREAAERRQRAEHPETFRFEKEYATSADHSLTKTRAATETVQTSDIDEVIGEAHDGAEYGRRLSSRREGGGRATPVCVENRLAVTRADLLDRSRRGPHASDGISADHPTAQEDAASPADLVEHCTDAASIAQLESCEVGTRSLSLRKNPTTATDDRTGRTEKLTERQFEIVAAFLRQSPVSHAEQPAYFLSREDLMGVWGELDPRLWPSDNAVNNEMCRLRTRLKKIGLGLEVVRGQGYLLIEIVADEPRH